MKKEAVRIVKKRPTETGALSLAAVVAATLALLNIRLTSEQTTAVVVLLGAAPALLTRMVEWWRAR